MIRHGSTVSIEYTLTLADGSFVQSNVGKEPLRYVHGDTSLLPALQKELAGHGVNDEFKVQLLPEQAYGPVIPRLFQQIPLQKIPQEARTAGTLVHISGIKNLVRVHEIHEDVAVLDFNHPLAGKKIIFEIRILSIHSGHVLNGYSS